MRRDHHSAPDPRDAPTAPEAPRADEVRWCNGCGYDLRGLPAGRLCPECGCDPTATPTVGGRYLSKGGVVRRPLIDLLDTGSPGVRGRWAHGLGIAAFTTFAAAAAAVSTLALGVIGGVGAETEATVFALLSLAWVVATYVLLPASIARAWPWMRGVRYGAMLAQPAWLVLAGMAGFGAFASQRAPTGTVAMAGLFALGGSVCFIVMMGYVAEEAELHASSRRLNLVAWLLPIAGLIASIILLTFPRSFSFVPQGPWGLVFVLMLVPPFACILGVAYLLVQAGLAFLDMRRHAVWGQVHVEEARDRQARIDAKRAALARQAADIVRSLPTDVEREEIAIAPPGRGDGA